MDDLNEDFAATVAAVGSAASDFVGGNPAPYRELWARRDDVTIMGAWGAYERGWDVVGPRLDWAAARFAGGEMTPELLAGGSSGDLGYIVSLERSHTRLAGAEATAPMLLRVTHVYRRVDDVWKLVHRHADPIAAKTAPEAVLAPDGSS